MQDKIQQTIVIRSKFPDGNGGTKKLRTGKYCAQVAHASIAFLLNKLHNNQITNLTEEEQIWCNTPLTGQTKICLCVDTEQELFEIYQEAIAENLTVHIIKDLGLTEFKEPTFTCLAIGPHYKYKIDPITQYLKLF